MKKEYLDLTRLIERMHRRFLDVLRAELNRMEIKDLNAVQALLLFNVGEEEIVIRDLVETALKERVHEWAHEVGKPDVTYGYRPKKDGTTKVGE